MFFDSWTGLLRVIVVGVLAYVALIVLLRVSGKRTLSKLNAFDFVVTVALGSTLATILLSNQVALVEGILAFMVLIGAQYIITSISTRYPAFRKTIKASPRLLVYRGEVLHDALREERVTADEVRQVVRRSGTSAVEDVDAVVLETDGSLGVLNADAERPSVLSDVAGYQD